jgi:GAF domain-containing protein
VIGALTVQSTERGAFSAEDITMLQTMADQLANALQNARLFALTQEALTETETLYQISQQLLTAHDEETVYGLAMKAISQSNSDTATIYIYLDRKDSGLDSLILEQKATWAGGTLLDFTTRRYNVDDMLIESFIPQHGHLLIEDTTANDSRLTEPLRRELMLNDVHSLLALPLSTYQRRLGFLLLTNKGKDKGFTPPQIRYYTTITQQMVIALENIRLLTASERRARREEVIRQITNKIRGATTTDEILKTTVTELSKALGSARGGITLGFDPQLWQVGSPGKELKQTSPENGEPEKQSKGK